MPHGTQLWPEAVELLEVALGQLTETAAAEWGEAEPDHPLVAAVGAAPDQAGGFGAIEQLDRAVVA